MGVEADIKSWWCKLTDHTCFTNDQKREILSKYVIGDVLSDIRPDYLLAEVPKTLRIAMCGITGAGKSSLALTMKTASIKDAAVLGWLNEVGQGDPLAPMPMQLGGEQHIFTVGKKKEEQMLIELVDNRGWLNNATQTKEALDIIKGKIPTNIPVQRDGDPVQDYVQHFKSAFPQKAERYHLCILVIPADLGLEKVDMYIELRNLIKMTRIPVLHIFTKLDLPNAKDNVSALKAKLGLGEYDALELTCYNASKGRPKTDEEINSQALFALLWAIVIADSKGLPICNEKQIHIAQREVAKLVSNTTAIVKQKAGQESKLMYGLVLIIILLVVNIFVRF
eukprot:Phypoly_transcript_11832.p1 GENE.Phypoly_transcript_11832~~Phypoly_transcript_11832.p1  ORF type:complete len:384 (+),score=55.58 Phypoly_transcript_11832:143-1153(+)